MSSHNLLLWKSNRVLSGGMGFHLACHQRAGLGKKMLLMLMLLCPSSIYLVYTTCMVGTVINSTILSIWSCCFSMANTISAHQANILVDLRTILSYKRYVPRVSPLTYRLLVKNSGKAAAESHQKLVMALIMIQWSWFSSLTGPCVYTLISGAWTWILWKTHISCIVSKTFLMPRDGQKCLPRWI